MRWLAAFAVLVSGVAEAARAAPDARPLINLERSTQRVSERDFRLRLDLHDFLAEARRPGWKLTVKVTRLGGRWLPGVGHLHRTRPTQTHEVDASGLRADARSLSGDLVVRLKPQGKLVPAAWVVSCSLQAAVRPVGPQGFWPKDDIDIRTWPYYFIYPQSQGAAWELSGRWKATIDGKECEGELSGFLAPPLRPGLWNMGEGTPEGVRFDFDLGRKRRNWNYGRLALYQFREPRDLSGFAGLRLEVATGQPRTDCEVSLWLREHDGSWYRLKAAVPLVDRLNAATALFEDFREAGVVAPEWSFDEDYSLDLSAITHLGVGIINGDGIGKVSFTIRKLEAVRLPPADLLPAEVVVTGKTLSVNGHDVVPVGIFGGYWDLPQEFRPGCFRHFSGGPTVPPPGHSEKFHIDVWHDRYQPALNLTDPQWKDKLTRRAQEYARKAKEAGYQAHLELWNEPYLNWARTQKNFQPRFFDVSKAREGGPVTVKATGKQVPHFQWTREHGQWRVIDTTQHTYYSARGNGWLYDQMLLTVAKAIKEVNPDVQVIVSWGFRWKADNWAAWELEYKPSIDRCMPYVDGACEHHYGGEPTALVGMYEVLTAYGVTRYGKWLHSYNTETGQLQRIPVHGRVDTPEKAASLTHYRKALYELRDILYCASQAPDKLRSRTILTWFSQAREAVPVAYGLLENLRGRLVEATSSDEKLWCVASVDGTDSNAMPPHRGRWLVLVLFNDRPVPRRVRLRVAGPRGVPFEGGSVQRVHFDPETFEFGLLTRKIAASDAVWQSEVVLPGPSACKITLPLRWRGRKGQKLLPEASEVRRTQFFSPDLLRKVERGRPFSTTVKLDPEVLSRAKRAWLRLVVEDVASGEGVVGVGRSRLPLPKAYTAENVNKTVMLPIKLEDLKPQTALTFTVQPGNHAGYRVDMTSVVLEERGTRRAPSATRCSA